MVKPKLLQPRLSKAKNVVLDSNNIEKLFSGLGKKRVKSDADFAVRVIAAELEQKALEEAKRLQDLDAAEVSEKRITDNAEIVDFDDIITPIIEVSKEEEISDPLKCDPRDKWNKPLKSSGKVTIGQFLAAFLSLSTKGHVPNYIKDGMLKLFGLVFDDDEDFPTSLYLLQKDLEALDFFESYDSKFVCKGCGFFVESDNGSPEKFICTTDDCDSGKNNSVEAASFCYSSIRRHLKEGLESKAIKTSAEHPVNSSPGIISSFCDGQKYKELKDIMGEQEFIVVSLSSDGARTAKSSTANSWFGMFSVLQPDRTTRPRIHTLFYKPANLKLDMKDNSFGAYRLREGLSEPLIRELHEFGTEGLNISRDGKIVNVKVFVHCYLMDTQESYIIMCYRNFHGAYGCNHCEKPGEIIQHAGGKATRKYPVENGDAFDTLRNCEENRARVSDKNMIINFVPHPKLGGLMDVGIVKRVPAAFEFYKEYRLANRGLRNPKKLDPEKIKLEKTFRGVKGPSLLHKLPNFDECQQVPPDPMHALLEGVCKDFLYLMILDKTWKLPERLIDRVNSYLSAVQPTYSFQRNPRYVTEFKLWKANEHYFFSCFAIIPALTYALNNEIPEDQMVKSEQEKLKINRKFCRLFMRFSAIIQLFFCGEFETVWEIQLRKDIFEFMKSCQETFGPSFMKSNFHQLSHFISYIDLLGPPHVFWCFESESEIGHAGKHQQQYNMTDKEIMRKVALSDAAKCLENFYVKKSTDSVADLISGVCHNLTPYDKSFRTKNGRAYLTGLEKLERFCGYDADEGAKLKQLLEKRYGDRLNDFIIWVASAGRTSSGFLVKRQSRPTIRRKRFNGAYLLENNEMALFSQFIVVSRTSNTEDCDVFIFGTPTEKAAWDYFGFADDPMLKEKLYQKLYAQISVKDNDRILNDIDEVVRAVIILPRISMTSDLLAISEFTHCPS